MPVIDEDRCSGCELCVHACGPACLEMENKIAVLTLPEACGSEEHCIGVCPEDAIHMAWLPWTGDTSRGKWKTIVSDSPQLAAQSCPEPQTARVD